MKRYLLLALAAFVPVMVSFGSGCKKTVPTVEAGVDTAALVADAEAPPVAEADAAPAATLSAAHTAVVVKSAAKPKEGGDFQGTYTCFAGMTVVQSGNNVSARQKPADTQNYATFACTASGDTCDGTTTIFVAGKPSGTKKASLKRSANGDLTYKADGEGATLCHKK